MIRIASKRFDSRTMVSVAGKLEERYLAELQEHCSRAVPAALIFDLSDLKSVDTAGIRWLGERSAQGDEVKGASPYIKLLLEREESRSDSLTSSASRATVEDGE